ncbi:nucleoplasmin-like isoform X1 [Pseudophryne corroboree]|uniref:nucleoplasmin-like isoform X1 n=1 Tax=Pseudophryne corroboree TaxID=495146 RepID=UPI00308176A8
MPGLRSPSGSRYIDRRDPIRREGCELSASCRTCVFEIEEDYLVHFLELWTICLGATRIKGTQVIAVETNHTDGEPITIATLHPNLLPMVVNVHGLEFIPPVTFSLRSGSGPVYISGQHITLEDNVDSSLEEEVTVSFS